MVSAIILTIAAVSLISCYQVKDKPGTIKVDKEKVIMVEPGEYAYTFDTKHLYTFKEDMALFETGGEKIPATVDSLPLVINRAEEPQTMLQQFLAPFNGDSSKLRIYDPKLTIVPKPNDTYEVDLKWMTKQNR